MKILGVISAGISVNPMVCSGAPCIPGRRIHTSVILAQFLRGDSVGSIAKSYDLKRKEVESAIRFEYALKGKQVRRQKKMRVHPR